MKNRVWRKKGEGLKFTVKGSKNLADGHWLHLIVAMAYGKYVVLKEVYKKLKGPIITKYIRDILHCVCRIWAKKKRERTFFIMDNDPSQWSKVAERALEDIEAELHEIHKNDSITKNLLFRKE